MLVGIVLLNGGDAPSDVVPAEALAQPTGADQRPPDDVTAADTIVETEQVEEIFAGNAELAKLQLHNAAFTKNFVFPDGELIQVRFNEPPSVERFKEERAIIEAPENLAALVTLAEAGNDQAARRFLSKLDDCNEFPFAEYAEGLRAIEWGELPATEEQLREASDAYAMMAARCKPVRDDVTRDVLKRRVLAALEHDADNGDPYAAIVLARRIEQTDPYRAFELYRQAWRVGLYGSMEGMGKLYSRMPSPSYQDSVSAFAFSYAGLAAATAFYDGKQSFLARWAREYAAKLEVLEQSVSPSIRDAGLEGTKRLLRERPIGSPYSPH